MSLLISLLSNYIIAVLEKESFNSQKSITDLIINEIELLIKKLEINEIELLIKKLESILESKKLNPNNG